MMGFLSGIKKVFLKPSQSSRLEKIGNVEAVCPYCDVALEERPARKNKCPNCGNFIYVRTRPVDDKKVLVTEAQIDLIEEQWAIYHGIHDEYLTQKAIVEQEKAELTQRFGCPPAQNDVQWSLLNKQIIEHSKSGNWGFYRNTRFEMAEILRKEGKLKQALSTYLEVCYLDLNGPNNTGGITSPEILKKNPPFSADFAFLAPGIVERIVKIIKKLQIESADVQNMFIEIATTQCKNLKLSVSPKQAWSQLETQLFR
jgi:predicted RNA-binding Zn-ribbon protein involved in translation (DUF1610 family)